MKEASEIKVLLLAEWYPNDLDPQLGIFIEKHAIAISQFADVKLIYAYGKKGQKSSFEFQKEKKRNLEIVKTRFKKSTGLLRYRNFFRYRIALQKAFLEADFIPDLVHIHVPGRNTFLANFLKRKYDIPYGVTEHWHGWMKGVYKENRGKRKWIEKTLKRASFITVVSKELEQAIEESLPQKLNQKISIIPNVVDATESFETKKNKHILFVGDLDDEVKNISGLIQVFAEFSQSHPDWRMDIVGGGQDEASLRSLAKDLCQDKVTFKGRLANSETLQLYPQYSFFVSNSKYETFGVAMAEALMSGIPVVAPKDTGADQFLDESNSIRFSKEDRGSLKNALEKMSHHYQDFNTETLKKTVKKYNSGHVGAQFLDLYRRVLK